MASLPETTVTVQFDAALRAAATLARSRYAGEHARIERGLVIALNSGVTLHADCTATVQSSSDPEVQYRIVAGVCDCPDSTRAPDGRCKHWYAWVLVRKAQGILAAMQTPLRHAYHMASGEEGHARLLPENRVSFAPGGHTHSFVCHASEVCVGPVIQASGRPW